MTNLKVNLSEIKIGDFVEGSYQYGCVSGRVTKIYKNHVVVSQHQGRYYTFTDLKIDLNITTKRIYKINNPLNIYN